jgi:putative membrane protein
LEKGEKMSILIGLVVGILISALVIYIVGKLGLGMEVSGFGGAIIAAIVIAIVSAIIIWLLNLLGINFGSGILGAIVYLIVAAVVLMISDKFVSGLKVNGFGGAIIAAIAIGVVNWLVFWLLGLLGLV